MGIALRNPDYISPYLGLLLLFFGAVPSDGYARIPDAGRQAATDGQAGVHFTRSEADVGEGDGAVLVEVRLDADLREDLRVDVVYQPNLSSASPQDFSSPLTRTLRFEAGLAAGSVRRVSFELRDDSEFEGPEHATLVLRNLRSGQAATVGSPAALRLNIADNEQAGVVINEIQPATGADLDGDGRAGDGEAFVELLNTEQQEVDLSGWTLDNAAGATYRFPEGTILAGGAPLVIFNSPNPAGFFGGATVLGAPGFTPDGDSDHLILRDASGLRIDAHSYRDYRGRESSLVRSPEGRGAFTGHLSASRTARSPGLRSDGTYFNTSLSLERGRWHLLASPVPSLRLADLREVTAMQGFQGYEPLAAKNLYTGLGRDGFSAPDRLDGTFRPGSGFLLYLPDGSAGPATLRASGGTSSGNTTVELRTSGAGWNLLGNPYDRPVDLSGLRAWVRGGELASAVAQVWDARARSYRLVTPRNGRLEAWQGFLVENRGAVTLEIPESAQITPGDPAAGRLETGRRIAFRLGGSSPGGETFMDHAAELVFDEEATHGWDAMDASKLRPLSGRWATLSLVGQRDGRTLYKARESRPRSLDGGLSIPLEVRTKGISGTLEMGWNLEGLPESWELRLTDRVTGRQIDLRSRESYEFEHRGGATDGLGQEELTRPQLQMPAPEAGSEPRFTLSVRVPAGPQAVQETPESVRLNPLFPNPFSASTTIPFQLSENAHVRITVWNTIGAKVATLVDRPMEAGEHRETWTPSSLPQGIYRIMLEVDGQPYSRAVTYINP